MFADLEKVFDSVVIVLIESSLRRKRVVEYYVKAVIKMYKEVLLSQVKVEGENMKEFAVQVGIHQGLVLSPYIFIYDDGHDRRGSEMPSYTLDDLVLICKTKEKARWRYVA